jgi:hypothetical protein
LFLQWVAMPWAKSISAHCVLLIGKVAAQLADAGASQMGEQ